ncbi:MAG: hypothetical protein MUF71_02055 [Candidatus Kapabacteria bacterium]|jgi:hypothetical protein|nr:hypothetical protein [Candidatus Kapabacteria bacterium]
MRPLLFFFRWILLCLFWLGCAETGLAQSDRLRYILPDVCAPNMSAYLELYAAPWDINAFGKDSLYANNPNDSVRVELVRPADSTKIVLGPVVVSWQGRLISTQVFVLPNVASNDSNWRNLRSEFRIPIRVVVRGRADSLSNADTLYIVNPYTNLSAFTRPNAMGDTVRLGEIALADGKVESRRSRRGAIIVDNLTFPERTDNRPVRYVVSTVDTDSLTEGNQGFLPFVMLARGRIDGNGAILSANADGKNAGVGGGGGGGQVCDILGTPSVPRMTGGNGYTGGASGGQNQRNPFIDLTEQQWDRFSGGIGSGEKRTTPLTPVAALDSRVQRATGGTSLNGVIGGTSRSAVRNDPEASGGGTGHPFGTSGRSWDGASAAEQKPGETSGGGIGRSDGIEGDGGGFGTNGYSAAFNREQGGLRHGNEAVVPIAGGSGGASGNPRGAGSCAGEGGGGGGAIRIAGVQVRNMTIEAKGAEGSIGNNIGLAPAGGAGSGGHIAVHSWMNADSLRVNVLGGDSNRSPYYGAGRLRYDTPNRINVSPFNGTISPPEFRSSTADSVYSSYTGITIEPRREIVSPYTTTATLTGLGGSAGGIYFFRKTLRGRWEGGIGDSVLLGTSAARGFNSPIRYEGVFTPTANRANLEQDSLLFVAVVQRSFFPTPLGAEVIPEWIMSQSGTSILRIIPLPFIQALLPQGSTWLDFPALERCGQEERTSTAVLNITNTRGGLLRIDSVRVLNPLFSIDTLLRQFTVRQGETLRLPLRFRATAAFPADSLFATTTLEIFHNDTIPDIGGVRRFSPLVVPLRAPVRTIRFSIQRSVADATINFGNVAIGSFRDTIITIANTSRDAVRYTVSAARPLNEAPFLFAERTLSPSDTIQLRIRFQPMQQGAATTQTVIVRVNALGRCTDEVTFRYALQGTGTRPLLDIGLTGPVNIGSMLTACFPETAQTEGTLTVASAGNDVLRVDIRMANSPSVFTPLPTTLVMDPNREQIVRLRFTAPSSSVGTTTYRDTVVLTTTDPRPEGRLVRFPVSITVQNIAAQVRILPQNSVQFGTVRYFIPLLRTIYVSNAGNVPVTVNLTAPRAPFRLIRPPQTAMPLSVVLPAGATDSLIVEMLATDAQVPDVVASDVIRLSYSNVQPPCQIRQDTIPLLGTPSGPMAMQARIWLDTLRDVNMLRDTSVRIWGQVLGTAFDRRDNFRAALRVRRGMFFPRSVQSPFGNATLDSNRTDSLDRIFVLTVPNVRLTASTTLIATVNGTPILTDTMRSAVEWIPSQTRWSRGDSVYAVFGRDYGNGLLVTTVVLQGANNAPRLPNNAPRRTRSQILALYPAPAKNMVTLDAIFAETGAFTVQVANMLGRTLFQTSWNNPTTDIGASNKASFTLPLENLANGVYAVILTAPSGERSSMLITVEQ